MFHDIKRIALGSIEAFGGADELWLEDEDVQFSFGP